MKNTEKFDIIYVSIIEDNEIYIETLKEMFSDEPTIRISGVYYDCLSALKDIETNLPDIVLLDVELPDKSGVDFIRDLKLRHPRLEIIILTVFEDDKLIFDAVKNGATGYLLKNYDGSRIVESIQNVYAGLAAINSRTARKIIDFIHKDNPAVDLTHRERQVLDQIREGKSNKEISEALNVSVDDIRFHCKKIYRKLMVKNKIEAILKMKNNK